MTKTQPPRAAIYARFSSDKQNDRSIADQVALCRKLAAREGYSVVQVFEDRAVSGASLQGRLGFQRLMREARGSAFDVVLAEALDRLSRDQEDLAGIHKRLSFFGIDIVTAQDGLAGDIHVGVKGLLGALYLKDLADKTRRGQAGVLRDGRHNGGRSFGYRNTPGQPGVLTIDEAEAATVRRIFADYLAGQSPREIAIALNQARVRGPRGGHWNASTIGGSKARRNGILQNELYAGTLVWNRQRFVKDPDTGKRVSRPNAASEWLTAPAEQLRIIDAETWAQVQDRRADRAHRWNRTQRPKHMLSGLVKCGRCGSSYISAGSDKRGPALFCSRARETGLCDNRRSIGRGVLEQRVIAGLETHLVAPDVIAEYIREFHRAAREMNARAAQRTRQIERRLPDIEAAMEKTIDQLIYGTATAALRERLGKLEAERDQMKAELAQLAPLNVTPHPTAAEDYRRKVADLKRTLENSDEQGRAEAFAVIRSLVEKIVVHPRGPRLPVDIELHGQLATLLKFSCDAANLTDSSLPESGREVVAGTRSGFTPRLPPLIVRVCSR